MVCMPGVPSLPHAQHASGRCPALPGGWRAPRASALQSRPARVTPRREEKGPRCWRGLAAMLTAEREHIGYLRATSHLGLLPGAGTQRPRGRATGERPPTGLSAARTAAARSPPSASPPRGPSAPPQGSRPTLRSGVAQVSPTGPGAGGEAPPDPVELERRDFCP